MNALESSAGNPPDVNESYKELRDTFKPIGSLDNDDMDATIPFRGRGVLNNEQQGTLLEILRCAVCLEIPKGRNMQVKICGKGHHFCQTCHKQLKSCAICRGRLFSGRNFVVEDLLARLGGVLGVTKYNLPKPLPAPPIPGGIFCCPHSCQQELLAISMLAHIRNSHAEQFVDNLRSNPYTNTFDYIAKVNYRPNVAAALSFQVSDYGLFSLVIRFTEGGLDASVQGFCAREKSDVFSYNITVQYGQKIFGALKSPVIRFLSNLEGFNVPKHNMPDILTTLTFYVSIWRNDMQKKIETDSESAFLTLADPIILQSDRNNRRNSRRRQRKKALKAILRQREVSSSTNPANTTLSKTSSNRQPLPRRTKIIRSEAHDSPPSQSLTLLKNTGFRGTFEPDPGPSTSGWSSSKPYTRGPWHAARGGPYTLSDSESSSSSSSDS